MKQDMFSQDFDSVTEEVATKKQRRLRDYELPFWHQMLLMLLSTGIAFLSLLPLYLTELASSQQSQVFYLGWAFTQGQLPYTAVYSQSGILFAGLVGLANFLGGVQWLIPIQLIAHYFSGALIYKLLLYWTDNTSLAKRLSTLFYLFQLAFGLGGFYSIQLATPFVLLGLWLAVSYLDGLRRDEIFVAYGLNTALALALDPRTLIFWVLAFIVLSIANISRGLWARGFYQNLAMTFGFILIIYPLSYFAINLEMMTPYIQQSFSDSFKGTFDLSSGLNIGLRALTMVGTGLLTGLFFLPKIFRQMAEQRTGVVLLTLLTIFYGCLSAFTPSIDLSPLLFTIPFGLLLTGLSLTDNRQQQTRRASRRHQASKLSTSFMKRHFYLPLLTVIASLTWIASPLVTEQDLQQSREQVATYLIGQTTASEKIYIWDSSSDIYLTSQRLSASQIAVPTAYPGAITQQQIVDELLQGQASYIVVNTDLALPQQLREKLANDYQIIQLDGLSQLTIYQKN